MARSGHRPRHPAPVPAPAASSSSTSRPAARPWARLTPTWPSWGRGTRWNGPVCARLVPAYPARVKSIRDEGKVYSATGDGRVPWVSADDTAAVAVRALTTTRRPTPTTSSSAPNCSPTPMYDYPPAPPPLSSEKKEIKTVVFDRWPTGTGIMLTC
ncbi:hypothetical protein L209DRAFT_810113 [Thermothelomyces heterothallicus CBS 203.75]